MLDYFTEFYEITKSSDFIGQIRWQDVVDILLLTLILYRFFLFIQGTKTLRMLVGLGFLLVAFAFSNIFGITAVNWIFKNFFSSIILIMIVLFQDDIRNALATFGRASFLWERENNQTKVARILSDCCRFFSKTRTGALIVLQQEIGLKDLQVGGTTLNANISKPLMLTLFNRHTALHDGALIIQDDVIEIAGAILPLSSAVDSDSGHGTRHRAGIGISEKSDCISIIVSEETGSISVAQSGRLSTVNPDFLEKYLSSKLR